jgi:hypothetical protein
MDNNMAITIMNKAQFRSFLEKCVTILLDNQTKNARILVSRNKREGKFLLNERKIYKKTRYGKLAPVNFADLGIKLHTPEEANGQR